MVKKVSTLVLCIIVLLSFAACSMNTTDHTPSPSPSNAACSMNTADHTPSPSNETVSIENATSHIDENEVLDDAIFNTKNINRITFYAYYGEGKGSEVPADCMAEITDWLGTFTIDKEVDDILPPGTNTYYVEIEYLDGTIVKKGLDVIIVDGTSYFVKHDTHPACFMDIVSKTGIE